LILLEQKKPKLERIPADIATGVDTVAGALAPENVRKNMISTGLKILHNPGHVPIVFPFGIPM